ncbi:MAG: FtsQ-type POTRA domain-containing protein [Acidobacteriota bacterium]
MSHSRRRGLPAAPAVGAPADRRFRRADVANRRRYRRTAWRALRWTLPVVGGCGLLVWLGAMVLHSEMLRIRKITVTGNVYLSGREVETLVDGIRTQNLLQADLADYRRRVLDSPWVADARLSRVLPATVTIHVTERMPMAIARLGEQLYLVDVNGVVIDEYGPRYNQFDLPVVDGLIVSPKSGGSSVPADRVQLAASLITALSSRTDLRKQISQVDVTNPRDAAVMFGDDTAWLHLGDARFVERLQNYIDLRSTLRERFSEIDYVDLRFDERVYLRGPAVRTSARAVSR